MSTSECEGAMIESWGRDRGGREGGTGLDTPSHAGTFRLLHGHVFRIWEGFGAEGLRARLKLQSGSRSGDESRFLTKVELSLGVFLKKILGLGSTVKLSKMLPLFTDLKNSYSLHKFFLCDLWKPYKQKSKFQGKVYVDGVSVVIYFKAGVTHMVALSDYSQLGVWYICILAHKCYFQVISTNLTEPNLT